MKKYRIAIAINFDWPLQRYHKLFEGIQAYADNSKNWLLIWDHYPECRLEKSKTQSYYDGVIGRISFETFEQSKRLNIPVVNTWSSNLIKDITTVTVDYFKAGEMAAEHLLLKGFRNFVNIDYRANESATSFNSGFMNAAKDYNCKFERHLISYKCTSDLRVWDKLNSDFKKWSKQWRAPLGIYSSLSAIGSLITAKCIENGFRIPEDIAVITSGNELAYCEGSRPSISSIEINYFKIGYEAARVLDHKLQNKTVEHELIRMGAIGCIPRESTDNYAVQDNDLKNALRFINDNYQKNILVPEVVDYVKVSRSTLERKFLKIIGHTVFDEINRLRICSAQRLLLETDLEIAEIATMIGFSSSNHFIRVFKSLNNITPGKYREINRSG